MEFNSYIFILVFLPLSLAVYYFLNKFKRYTLSKAWLLAMSLYFYAYFNITYLPIMTISILFNFSINRLMDVKNNILYRRSILVIGILSNLGLLFYFKYYDFFISNINVAFNADFTLKHLLIPLGISFFTFQQLSFVIDSYKNTVPKYNLLDYSLFVTFFPQLIAGPIVLHSEIVPQLEDETNKSFNVENFSKGLMAFTFGLAKKVLIADTFAQAAAIGFADPGSINTITAIVCVLSYTFQVYFDFSGYSDMAIGIGLMFNVNIPLNFNSPYKALTITDFWKRWHITLTRFFTTYIYIPLGGNRHGKFRTYINIFTIFFVSGIWHGANWTFIIWGIMHGLASILTRLFKKKVDNFHPVLNWTITFGFINLSWIFFRANTVRDAITMIKSILKLNFGPISSGVVGAFYKEEFNFIIDIFNIEKLLEYVPYLFLLGFFIFAFFAILGMRNTVERIKEFKPTITIAVVTVILFTWSLISLSGVSTFIYFNF